MQSWHLVFCYLNNNKTLLMAFVLSRFQYLLKNLRILYLYVTKFIPLYPLYIFIFRFINLFVGKYFLFHTMKYKLLRHCSVFLTMRGNANYVWVKIYDLIIIVNELNVGFLYVYQIFIASLSLMTIFVIWLFISNVNLSESYQENLQGALQKC